VDCIQAAARLRDRVKEAVAYWDEEGVTGETVPLQTTDQITEEIVADAVTDAEDPAEVECRNPADDRVGPCEEMPPERIKTGGILCRPDALWHRIQGLVGAKNEDPRPVFQVL